mgnify:CR=1 FL=1
MASRTPLWGTLILLVTAVPAHSQSRALDAETLFERLSPSIWVVMVPKEGGKGTLGSAVVIDRDLLVTNCHVVDKATTITVASEKRELPATLLLADTQRDLCFLSVPQLGAPAVEVGDPHLLRVGSKLYAIGNPRGLELTLTDGLLSAARRNSRGDLQALQTSVPISPGSSGGGLFNVYGQLVGITTWALKDSQGLNFAVPSHWLLQVSERAGAGASGLVLHGLPKPASPPPASAPTGAPAPVLALPSPAPAPAAAPPTPDPASVVTTAAKEPPAPPRAPAHAKPGAPPPAAAFKEPAPSPIQSPAPVVIDAAPPAAAPHASPEPVAPPLTASITQGSESNVQPSRPVGRRPPEERTARAEPSVITKKEMPVSIGSEPQAGRVYQYRLTDRIKSSIAIVEYRVDHVSGSRAVAGSRVCVARWSATLLPLRVKPTWRCRLVDG